MKVVNLTMLGRFGNQLFQYAFARKYAELSGAELRTEPWVGERLFEGVSHPRISERFEVIRSDLDFSVGETGIEIRAYAQSQGALLYTREEVRGWFRLREDLTRLLEPSTRDDTIIAHARRGDYFGYGYPVVSIGSYQRACQEHGLAGKLKVLSEENPTTCPAIPGELSFLPDFYRMMRAPVLLRANSTFSWWAGTLGSPGQKVFSPVIDGLVGGREHDVPFVEGNHPRLANTSFTTELFLK